MTPSSARSSAPSKPAADLLPAAPSQGATVARSAGRGGLAVAVGKGYFILIGFVQQVALKRVLGLDGFGALSSALSLAGIAYNPIVSTSIQGVSRAVAQADPAEQPAVIRRVLLIHALFALPVALAFFLLASPVGHFVGMPHVVPSLRVLSAVLLCYGLYAPLVGVVNGQQRFHWQAGFDMAFATVRTVLLLAGGYGFSRAHQSGVLGASFGFAAAAAMICAAALGVVGLGRAGGRSPTARQHLGFIGPLLLGQILLNLLLQADLTLLRYFAAGAAVAAGRPEQAADSLVGAYRATQLFSFLPYQLLISVTFVLFPLLATAYRNGEREAVKRYVHMGVRVALIVAGGMVCVTAGLAAPLLRIVFGQDASVLASQSMQLLVLGFGAFAILGILTTALNSLGRERLSTGITALAFGLVVVLSVLRVRGAPFGEEILWRTATGTSLGILLATLVAAGAVKHVAGGVVPVLSVLRVLLAMAGASCWPRYGVGESVVRELGIVGLLLHALVMGTAYGLILLCTRELGRADWSVVRDVISRRRSK